MPKSFFFSIFKCFLHTPADMSNFDTLWKYFNIFKEYQNSFWQFSTFTQFCIYFGKPRFQGWKGLIISLSFPLCTWDEMFFKISYTMNSMIIMIIIPLPCIPFIFLNYQSYKQTELKSCSVWHFSGNKNNCQSVFLRLVVKIFSGVKIHAIWRLVLRLVKIFTRVKIQTTG